MVNQNNRFQHPKLALIAASILTLSLAACDRAEPVSYQIPKEDRSVNMPTTTPAAAQNAANSTPKMQVLPGMKQAADDAGDFAYTTPAAWVELPASGIRKANFEIITETGKATVTVLTFPGDVGGILPNINRWAGQIGLNPTNLEDLPKFTSSYIIAEHSGLFVRLEGEEQSILGGILSFHGFTWFFKMQGDSATVMAQEVNWRQFLDSIKMIDHAH
jgi:hypothetical protein